jgi:hypothetical protein
MSRNARSGWPQTGSWAPAQLDLPLPDLSLSLRLVWREDRESLPGMRDILYAAARP